MEKVLRLTGMLSIALLGSAAQAQTCNADIAATAPDSRYTAIGDGTVFDTATGLMWKQCPEGLSGASCTIGGAVSYSWQGALQQAETVNKGGGYAGHTNWRLPNHKQLASLVETKCYAPAINATLFPNTPSSEFLSSSPFSNDVDLVWTVGFNFGDDQRADKLNEGYVRLVRGGK